MSYTLEMSLQIFIDLYIPEPDETRGLEVEFLKPPDSLNHQAKGRSPKTSGPRGRGPKTPGPRVQIPELPGTWEEVLKPPGSW